MNFIKGFGIKVSAITIVTFAIFGIMNDTTIIELLWISFIVSSVTYIWDLFVLPRAGYLLTVILDLILFFIIYWGLAILFMENTLPVLLTSIAATYLSVICDAVIHIYINEIIYGRVIRATPFQTNLQTEFAEEIEVSKEKIITEKDQN